MDGVLTSGSDTLWSRLATSLRPLSDPPQVHGWNHVEMADLLGSRPRRSAAVLVGLRESPQPRLILTVRTTHLPSHAGQVAFPGGSSDPGDRDAVATALRESQEEVALDPALVSPLGLLDCFETISGYCITPVVARVAAGASLCAAPDEVAEVFEVPVAFFLQRDNLRRYTMNYRGRQREMVEFIHDGYRIWGATAAMMLNLLQRMQLTTESPP